MRILLVEDDKAIARFVEKGLKENAFSVDVASNGEDGLHLAVEENYDLIILDIMLPIVSGDVILKTIRAEGIETPVIFLTAKEAQEDIVDGLNIGADDYMVKPFSFHELLARLRAILRRGKAGSSNLLCVADLTLDMLKREVKRGDIVIELTSKEYAILEYLIRHTDQVVTRTMISEHVWNYDFDTSTNVIDVHVNHLRSKVDEEFSPRLIHTVRGAGYVLKDKG